MPKDVVRRELIGTERRTPSTPTMVECDKKSNYANQAALAAKTDTPKAVPDRAHADQSNAATIYFYRREDPYFELTNFSDHSSKHRMSFEDDDRLKLRTVDCFGYVYATSEAAFQAAKFPEHPKIMRKIRQTTTASDALRLATELAEYKRTDWFDVNVEIMQAVVGLVDTSKRIAEIRHRWT